MLSEKEAVCYLFRYHFSQFRNKKIILYGDPAMISEMIPELSEYQITGRLSMWYEEAETLSLREAALAELLVIVEKKSRMQEAYDRIYYWGQRHPIPVFSIAGENLREGMQYTRRELPRIAEFRRSFADHIQDDMVLYGTGPIAEGLIRGLPEFHIAGMLDGTLKGGEKYGKPILALRQLTDLKSPVIVIAAKEENQLMIYRRIRGFCNEHLIPVMNFAGKNLAYEYQELPEQDIARRENSVQKSDVECADETAETGFVDKSPMEMLRMSSYADLELLVTNENERYMLELFAKKAFEGQAVSFALKSNRLHVTDFTRFIEMFVAPIVTVGFLNLVEILKKNIYDGILFASRDGWIFYRMYEQYRERYPEENLPQGYYFYTSRKAAGNAVLDEKENIVRIFSLPYEASPEQVLKEKLRLTDADILKFDESGTDSLVEYALLHKELLAKKARMYRANYRIYMKKTGLKEKGNYALFDLGTTGTTALFLEDIAPFAITSTAFLWYDIQDLKKQKLAIDPIYLDNEWMAQDNYNSMIENLYMKQNYPFFEPLLTSLESSIYGFDEWGKPIFEKDKRTKRELNRIETAHAAMMAYFTEFIENCDMQSDMVRKKFAEKIYAMKDSKYTDEHCRELNNYFNRDDLGAGKFYIGRK